MHRVWFFAPTAVLLFAATCALSFSASSAAYAYCAATNGTNSARTSRVVAGAQAGYNWQQGFWVYGLETDLSGTGLESSMSGGLSTPGCPNDAANTRSHINWYGTVRGRAGVTTGNFLFYGTGGFAYGKVDLQSNFNALALSTSAQTSSIRSGWVIGAGLEYLMQTNVFLHLGYQYVDLGIAKLISSTTDGFSSAIISQTASAQAAFHVATIGLNWKFAPTASKPWEGGYGGGHIGGAWGGKTNASYSSIFVTNCFTETTQVSMADGTARSISEVKVGDKVIGESGKINKVINIEVHFLGIRKLYAFNGGPPFVTPEHPFMTRTGWKSMAPEATLAETGNFSVGELKVGDEVLRLEAVKKRDKPMIVAGEFVPTPTVEVSIETEFSELRSITPHEKDPLTMVYNLKLDGNHTYFANKYLVHNK